MRARCTHAGCALHLLLLPGHALKRVMYFPPLLAIAIHRAETHSGLPVTRDRQKKKHRGEMVSHAHVPTNILAQIAFFIPNVCLTYKTLCTHEKKKPATTFERSAAHYREACGGGDGGGGGGALTRPAGRFRNVCVCVL